MSVNLSQILNSNPDPERGSGAPATELGAATSLIAELGQNARLHSEQKWRAYLQFQNNLKEVYKDLSAVQNQEVAQGDRAHLNKQAAQIYEEIARDPRAFFGGRRMNEIQAKLGKLQSEAVRSKSDVLFDRAHREFLARNPELNTEENRALVDQYLKQPLGSRSPYTLKMPTIVDAEALFQGVLTHPAVKTKFAETPSLVGGIGPDGKTLPGDEYIYEPGEGFKYNRDRFLTAWNGALFTGTDKYGHSIASYAGELYKKLPDTQRQYYDAHGGVPAMWNDLGAQRFGSDTDITEGGRGSLRANPNFRKADEIAQGWARIGLDKRKLDKEDRTDLSNADSQLREVASIIDKGQRVVSRNFKNTHADREVLEIGDPTLLVSFGKIDKNGNTTNVPDAVQYDPTSDELNLVYYKKDALGATVTENGKRVVEEQKALNPRTWLKQKVKLAYPNKDIGGVNELVEKVFTRSGGNLMKLKELYFPSPDSVNVEALRKKYNY